MKVGRGGWGGERGCWGEGRRGRGDGVGVRVGRGGWGGREGVLG